MSSKRDPYFERTDWSGRGKAMAEEAYHQLNRFSPERRYEYINGLAYPTSGGSIEHDLLRRNIEATLARHLRAGPCRVFGVDVQVLLGNRQNGKPHYVYPETTVSCEPSDRRRGNTLVESPRAVVEVLSPGTEAKDRGIKFKAYQQCPTIQEIVLISQFAPRVEVRQRNAEDPENPKAWHYRPSGPEDPVMLASLGIQISMADIYQDLDFEDEEDQDSKDNL